jgi:hypothetical protein
MAVRGELLLLERGRAVRDVVAGRRRGHTHGRAGGGDVEFALSSCACGDGMMMMTDRPWDLGWRLAAGLDVSVC